MKVIAQTSALQEALGLAGSIVATRTPKPVLQCVKLIATKEGGTSCLTLLATDLEAGFRYQITAVEVEREGESLVPAERLAGIVRESNEASLTIEAEKEACHVRGAGSKFRILGYDPAEFPVVANFEGEADFEVSAQVLSEMIGRTLFAAAKAHSHYAMSGVLWEAKGKKLQLVATDGHRLALTDKAIDLEVDGIRQYIVPRKGVLEIVRLLNVADAHVKLSIGENHLRVAAGKQALTTKLVDGRFPDYERVIPRESDNSILADREVLRAGLSRASILSNEKFRGIRLILKKNLLTAVAHNPEQEEAEEEIEVEYAGDTMEVGFNVSYLLDVLGVMRTDMVRLDLVDANSSCLIRAPESNSSRYVVMPMRL